MTLKVLIKKLVCLGVDGKINNKTLLYIAGEMVTLN